MSSEPQTRRESPSRQKPPSRAVGLTLKASPAPREFPTVSAWINERLHEGPSWLASVVLHLSLLVVLWTIVLSARSHETSVETIFGGGPGAGEELSLEGPIDIQRPADGTDLAVGEDPATGQDPPAGDDRRLDWAMAGADAAGDSDSFDRSEFTDAALGDVSVGPAREPDRSEGTGVSGDLREPRVKASRIKPRTAGAKEQGANLEGILDGRTPEARAKLVKSGGGTEASEKAVELGLKWLARHQDPDGSWSFQHGPDDPGLLHSPNGATGLALLAFLGAGNTHKQGEYRSHVDAGLKYLVSHMELKESGGWLLGTGQSTMYVQGIGAIALCEAYSMTKDPALRRHAQLAIDFIVKAQDPESGGWRYRIPQAGDTSVTGWQLMALQSAKVAELSVPARVIVRATRFLKSVESEGGALYEYFRPGSIRPTMTAVGLLCRMYLGREPTHKGMIRGVGHLSQWGPNSSDMYYSYYATQVMHHWGGSLWPQWNAVMRDQLVSSQAQSGDAAGSWRTDESHGAAAGGRLYTTCLSIMTLEVYYRHLSLYRRNNAADDL